MSAKAVGTLSIAKPSSSSSVPRLPVSAAAGSYFAIPVMPASPLGVGAIHEGKSEEKPPSGALVLASSVPGSLSLGASQRVLGALPPPLNLTPKFTKCHRFTTTAATSVTLSVNEIIGALGGICTVVNSVVTHWTTSFRIIKLEIYPSVSTTVISSTVVEWNTGLSGSTPDQCMSLVTPGGVITAAPRLLFRPPAKSLASDWMDVGIASTNVMNLFNVPNASVIDLTVESTLGVTFAASALTSAVAAGVVGTIYYLDLDGPASHKVIPAVGYPTTH